MKKTIIFAVVVVVIGAGIYYFLLNNSSYSPTPSASLPVEQSSAVSTPTVPVSDVSAAPAPSSVTVSIKNFAFNPQTLTVKKGTKVTWVNDDTAAHTVTSDSGSLLNSSTLSPGQSFSFTFENIGTENYHCNIHRMMKAAVIIEN